MEYPKHGRKPQQYNFQLLFQSRGWKLGEDYALKEVAPQHQSLNNWLRMIICVYSKKHRSPTSLHAETHWLDLAEILRGAAPSRPQTAPWPRGLPWTWNGNRITWLLTLERWACFMFSSAVISLRGGPRNSSPLIGAAVLVPFRQSHGASALLTGTTCSACATRK